jgi:hypothetical protein
MEFKWFMIFLAIGAISLAVGVSIDGYYDAQCKIAAITANKTSADITAICGKV